MNKEQIDDIEYVRKNLMEGLKIPPKKMSDSEHLQWIHDRIVNVYGENENVDFLIRFRTIINEFSNQNKDEQ